jgi:hypothetical protein
MLKNVKINFFEFYTSAGFFVNTFKMDNLNGYKNNKNE